MNILTTILKFVAKNILIIFFSVIAIYRIVTMTNSTDPEMIVFNIGQGDAILIQQDNFQILIDTGPDDSLIYELSKYMAERDRNIEVVVLTHPHEDHIQGIYSLLDYYRVSDIYFVSECFESKDFEYIKTHYGDILKPLASRTVIHYGGIEFEMIYPLNQVCHSNANDNSIVSKVTINSVTAMLMGDAEYEAERTLLSDDLLGRVDILKVGHHCSRTATSDMFLSGVSPALSICSCGEGNKFGHPHSETIEKFKTANVQYLITYQTGNIVFKFKKE